MACHTQLYSRVARPYSAPRERVWDMDIEQFVAPHHGVQTNHSTLFSHTVCLYATAVMHKISHYCRPWPKQVSLLKPRRWLLWCVWWYGTGIQDWVQYTIQAKLKCTKTMSKLYIKSAQQLFCNILFQVTNAKCMEQAFSFTTFSHLLWLQMHLHNPNPS